MNVHESATETTAAKPSNRTVGSRVWRAILYLLVAGYGLVVWPFAYLSAELGVRIPLDTDSAYQTRSFAYYVMSFPLYFGALVFLVLLMVLPVKRRWPWVLALLVAVASVALRRWYLVSHYPLWPVSG
ncbi:MAG: hypothetical protein KDE22_11025 [Rhodobacterales bacterium]|nr:hypothetical protein [Rhodobacterales bacterium]